MPAATVPQPTTLLFSPRQARVHLVRDRSLPGYYRLIGRKVPAHVEAAVATFPYRAQVFIAPLWPEIYCNDAERRQASRSRTNP